MATPLGATREGPFDGSLNPDTCAPAAPEGPRAAPSYLGTYAADRQAALEPLSVEPARRRPHDRFIIGGAQNPPPFPWGANVFFWGHLAAQGPPQFHASAPPTLHRSRVTIAALPACPARRPFDAPARATPLASDRE